MSAANVKQDISAPPPKTTAERQRALRQARAEAGLVEVRGIYAHPDDHAAIKEHAAKLRKRREKRSASK